MPDGCGGDGLSEAVDLVLATIVHEVRRARRRPVYEVHDSVVARGQQAALAFGWLTRAVAEPRLLVITEAGRLAAAEAQRRQLFPPGLRQIGALP